MSNELSSLANWTQEELTLGRRWVQAWRKAGQDMERLRREELRHLDGWHAISLLCGPADYWHPPRSPRPDSGLVEQQHWFKKAAGRD
jgi:hypothetical protein